MPFRVSASGLSYGDNDSSPGKQISSHCQRRYQQKKAKWMAISFVLVVPYFFREETFPEMLAQQLLDFIAKKPFDELGVKIIYNYMKDRQIEQLTSALVAAQQTAAAAQALHAGTMKQQVQQLLDFIAKKPFDELGVKIIYNYIQTQDSTHLTTNERTAI